MVHPTAPTSSSPSNLSHNNNIQNNLRNQANAPPRLYDSMQLAIDGGVAYLQVVEPLGRPQTQEEVALEVVVDAVARNVTYEGIVRAFQEVDDAYRLVHPDATLQEVYNANTEVTFNLRLGFNPYVFQRIPVQFTHAFYKDEEGQVWSCADGVLRRCQGGAQARTHVTAHMQLKAMNFALLLPHLTTLNRFETSADKRTIIQLVGRLYNVAPNMLDFMEQNLPA